MLRPAPAAPALARAAALAVALLGACASPQPCPVPLTECNGSCVDLQTDPRHCGECTRACPAGLVCRAAGCAANPGVTVACPDRTGGAFVTLGACGQTVKAWIRSAAFVAEARAQRDAAAADPAFLPTLAPLLGVRARADCDAQWAFSLDGDTAAFVPAAALDPAPACSACPRAVQGDLAAWLAAARPWCPTGARVLAVDERPVP